MKETKKECCIKRRKNSNMNIDLYKMSAYTTLPVIALQNTTKYYATTIKS